MAFNSATGRQNDHSPVSEHAGNPDQCAGDIVEVDKKGTLAAAMQAIADQNG